MQGTYSMSSPWHLVRRKTTYAWSRVRRRFFTTHVIGSGHNAGKRIAVRRPNPAFIDGSYEATIQNVIADNLYEGAVFYDVGANIGFFSLLASPVVGPSGAVYAFEPVPSNAAAIRQTKRLNQLTNIQVFEEAVAQLPGRADLMLTHHIGGASLASSSPPRYVTKVIDVAVTTIDSVISERRLRPPTMVKIDVEGAELDVLHGMSETLTVYRPTILYEIDDATQDGLAHKLGEAAQFLKAAGYRLIDLPPAYPDIPWKVAHVLALPIPKQ